MIYLDYNSCNEVTVLLETPSDRFSEEIASLRVLLDCLSSDDAYWVFLIGGWVSLSSLYCVGRCGIFMRCHDMIQKGIGFGFYSHCYYLVDECDKFGLVSFWSSHMVKTWWFRRFTKCQNMPTNDHQVELSGLEQNTLKKISPRTFRDMNGPLC